MENINLMVDFNGLSQLELKRVLKKKYPDLKYCKAGNHIRSKTEFAKNGGGMIRSICKECYNKSFRDYYKKNKERWVTNYSPKNYAQSKQKKLQKLNSEAVVDEENKVVDENK